MKLCRGLYSGLAFGTIKEHGPCDTAHHSNYGFFDAVMMTKGGTRLTELTAMQSLRAIVNGVLYMGCSPYPGCPFNISSYTWLTEILPTLLCVPKFKPQI